MRVILLSLLLIDFVSGFRQKIAKTKKLDAAENEELQSTCGKLGSFGRPIRKGYGTQRVNRRVAPWAISIIRSEDRGQGIGKRLLEALQYCSGTLISSRHVLTAAHCVDRYLINERLVIVDNDCSDAFARCDLNPYYVRRITKVFYPANYPAGTDESTHSSDIAIVELEEDIPFSRIVYPACMANTLPQLGDTMIINGFGSDEKPYEDPAKLSGVMQAMTTKVVECSRKTFLLKFEYDHFCTSGEQHVCSGDSGSGLISEREDGTKTVIGVTSNGSGDCSLHAEYNGTDDANVRVAPHMNWICRVSGICPKPFEGYSYQGELITRPNEIIYHNQVKRRRN